MAGLGERPLEHAASTIERTVLEGLTDEQLADLEGIHLAYASRRPS